VLAIVGQVAISLAQLSCLTPFYANPLECFKRSGQTGFRPYFSFHLGVTALSQIILDIPDESLLSLKLSDQTAGSEIRLAAAMKLYEMGRLSSGAAARLAGIPRVMFLGKLADYGINAFTLTDTDLDQETRLV